MLTLLIRFRRLLFFAGSPRQTGLGRFSLAQLTVNNTICQEVGKTVAQELTQTNVYVMNLSHKRILIDLYRHGLLPFDLGAYLRVIKANGREWRTGCINSSCVSGTFSI